MKTDITIDAGICGFKTKVNAHSEDNQFVSFEIESDCEKIINLAEKLNKKTPVDAFQEISPQSESTILQVTQSVLKGCCAGCVVPVGIFKSMQVAAGLALPKDISIEFV